MNNIDYWQGFQDALNLAEYELKTTKGDPLGNLFMRLPNESHRRGQVV